MYFVYWITYIISMTRDIIEMNDFTVFLEHSISDKTIIDKCAFEEDVIAFSFYGSGNVELSVQHGNMEKTYSITKGLAMSSFANKNTDFIHTVSHKKPLQCVLVCYSLKNLEKLTKQENKIYTQYLKELINPKDDFVEGPSFFMAHNMLNAVDKIFTTSYEGATRTMFLKSQVTELLSHFFARVSSVEVNTSTIKKHDREKLYKAKEILSKNIDTPPSLNELSKLIGLNNYKLKKNFKELFGFPVYKFLQQERLNKAHELLSSNDDITIQEAAWSVGYESLSSFSNAFNQKFGFRPSEVKR